MIASALFRLKAALLALLAEKSNEFSQYAGSGDEGVSGWADVLAARSTSAVDEPVVPSTSVSEWTITQLLGLLQAVPWLLRDREVSMEELAAKALAVRLVQQRCADADLSSISVDFGTVVALTSLINRKSTSGYITAGIAERAVLPAKPKHVWQLIKRLDLSLLSEQIAACEGLGPLPPGVGSTLRVLLLGPFSSPSDDIDNRLVLECHVVEVSEVEKRIVWDTHVLPSQEKFLGGCAGRRDFITVLGSHEKAPKGSPPPVCEVVWCCEVRKGVDAPPVPDSFLKLGIMSRLIAAFTSDVSPVRYLFPPQVASDAEIGSATSDDLPPGFARVILPSVNEPTPRPIASLSIGDVCVIRSGEVFAADMILLASTSPSETPVSYTNIDGSEALRLRKVKPELDNALAKLIPTPPSAGSTAASAEGEVLVAEPTPDDFANGVLCPVCTFRNDLFQPACEVCGTPLPAFGASTSSEAKTISRKAFLDVVGCGAEGVAAVAAFAGVSFTVTPSRIDGRMKAWFRFPGVDSIRLGSQQFLPAGAKLVFADKVLGVVVATGSDCYRSKLGVDTVHIKKRRRVVEEAAEKAWKTIDATLKSSPPWAAPGLDPRAYEASTGLSWNNHFTDVPDNGNCLLNAIHLGLTTLLRVCPSLKLAEYEAIPSDPDQLRVQAMSRLAADPEYRKSLSNMLRIWLELDASVLISQVEDFFTLPAEFQQRILAANQALAKAGTAPGNTDEFVDAYIQVLSTPVVGERVTYAPLGEPELDAMARVYQIRLQTVKSEKVKAAPGQSVPVVDPRTLRPNAVHEHYHGDNPSAKKRIIRVLNVSTNHYQVHLPTGELA